MNKYYIKKWDKIRKDIYNILCKTNDKQINVTEIMEYITDSDNHNLISDIINHG